jgi:hypothetical protein
VLEGIMRTRLFAALAVLTLWPVAASAVVTVQPEFGYWVPRTDQIVTIEIFATNPDAAENERLNAFTIALEAPSFRESGNSAPRFVIPPADPVTGAIWFAEPTWHPYVFGAYPGNGPVDPAGLSDFDTVLLSAALGGAGQEADINDSRNGFAKVSVFIPADMPYGFYAITLNPSFLSLGGAGAPITAVPGVGGFVYLPEPAAACLVASVGLLALRRRRR